MRLSQRQYEKTAIPDRSAVFVWGGVNNGLEKTSSRILLTRVQYVHDFYSIGYSIDDQITRMYNSFSSAGDPTGSVEARMFQKVGCSFSNRPDEFSGCSGMSFCYEVDN